MAKKPIGMINVEYARQPENGIAVSVDKHGIVEADYRNKIAEIVNPMDCLIKVTVGFDVGDGDVEERIVMNIFNSETVVDLIYGVFSYYLRDASECVAENSDFSGEVWFTVQNR